MSVRRHVCCQTRGTPGELQDSKRGGLDLQYVNKYKICSKRILSDASPTAFFVIHSWNMLADDIPELPQLPKMKLTLFTIHGAREFRVAEVPWHVWNLQDTLRNAVAINWIDWSISMSNECTKTSSSAQVSALHCAIFEHHFTSMYQTSMSQGKAILSNNEV